MIKAWIKKIKKEGLFKRLKNIEGKNEEQLKAIEDQGKKQLEEIKNINIDSKSLKAIDFFRIISEKAKELMKFIKQTDAWLGSAELICTKTDRVTKYNFTKFMFPLDFSSKFTIVILH